MMAGPAMVEASLRTSSLDTTTYVAPYTWQQVNDNALKAKGMTSANLDWGWGDGNTVGLINLDGGLSKAVNENGVVWLVRANALMENVSNGRTKTVEEQLTRSSVSGGDGEVESHSVTSFRSSGLDDQFRVSVDAY